MLRHGFLVVRHGELQQKIDQHIWEILQLPSETQHGSPHRHSRVIANLEPLLKSEAQLPKLCRLECFLIFSHKSTVGHVRRPLLDDSLAFSRN